MIAVEDDMSTAGIPEQERTQEMEETKCDEMQSQTENASFICVEIEDTKTVCSAE